MTSLPVATSIQRYAVIPLSTNSGLIGWVPHCDTLHALIRDYREKKKILLNIEHRIMLRVRATIVPMPLTLMCTHTSGYPHLFGGVWSDFFGGL